MKRTFLVLGTTSNCGKSFTTTALLRFFRRKGLRVAPFKAYNFSSKYQKTEDSRTMSYSTYLQTLAAEVPPLPEMNPVYMRPLKQGMELYLRGELLYRGDYQAYDDYFPQVREAALADYEKLKSDYDIVVMEGSGSPAEINCFKKDLANRVMAEYAEPYSLLVTDIDPGGAFAALHGTLELMPPDVRKTVKGFLINRFSGEREILKEGIDYLEKRQQMPCLGVMPWLLPKGEDNSLESYFAAIEALTDKYCDFDRLLK